MKKDIILTKHELHWHIIEELLEAIASYNVGLADKEFDKLFKAIRKHVDSKLKLNGNGNILDFYVMFLQEAGE